MAALLTTNASAPSGRIVRRVDVGADHPAFAGHFPGRPVWPGVALVAEVLEAARAEPELARRIGSAPRLGVVKFLAPVLPGARLEIEFRDVVGGIEFSVSDGGRIAASGRFSNGDAARSAP
jgi:3-hydroxyacyl-[acyl-carrier-protein] dehydratase